MKILFDQGTPAPLRRFLTGHDVSTAFEMGWSGLQNGELLAAAERNGFELLITTDKNLSYQQQLSGRALAVLALPTTSWPVIRRHIPEVISAVNGMSAGTFLELTFST